MHRHRPTAAGPLRRAGLPLALLPVLVLAACAPEIDWAPFGRSDAIGAPDSLTVRRVMGSPENVPPLLAEGGDVWPAQEAPRATLQNPDAVSSQGQQPSPVLERARERGAPPSPPRLQSEQPGTGAPPETAPNPRAPVPGTRRRGSSAEALPPLDPVPVPREGVPRGEPPTPPSRLGGNRIVPVPGGPPAIITGPTGGITTYTQPGGGSGTAIQQPGSTTLFGPTGGVQVVPTP